MNRVSECWIKDHLVEIARGTVREVLNALLDVEAGQVALSRVNGAGIHALAVTRTRTSYQGQLRNGSLEPQA